MIYRLPFCLVVMTHFLIPTYSHAENIKLLCTWTKVQCMFDGGCGETGEIMFTIDTNKKLVVGWSNATMNDDYISMPSAENPITINRRTGSYREIYRPPYSRTLGREDVMEGTCQVAPAAKF